MKRMHRVVLYAAPLIVALAAWGLTCYPVAEVDAQDATGPRTAVTEEQALVRVRDMVPFLAPGESNLTVTAELVTQAAKGARDRRLWDVVCADEAGHTRMAVLLQADADEVVSALAIRRRTRAGAGRGVTPSEAVDAARSAMCTLGIDRQAPRWQLKGRPTRTPEGWQVAWSAPGIDAWIALLQDGSFLRASTNRAFAVPIRWAPEWDATVGGPAARPDAVRSQPIGRPRDAATSRERP